MREYDLFKGITFDELPPYLERSVIWNAFEDRKSWKMRKEEFLQSISDAKFRSLNRLTGSNKMADVFHLLTAEKAGLDIFLTMDRKFINSIDKQAAELRTRTLSPTDLLGHIASWKVIDAKIRNWLAAVRRRVF